MVRKNIAPESTVAVLLTPQDRDLVLEHTFAGPNLTEPLRLTAVSGAHLVVEYTLDDLDERVGFIAA